MFYLGFVFQKKKKCQSAGEKSQSVKCRAFKHEKLSLHSQNPCGQTVCNFRPRQRWKQVTNLSWELQLVEPIHELQFQQESLS